MCHMTAGEVSLCLLAIFIPADYWLSMQHVLRYCQFRFTGIWRRIWGNIQIHLSLTSHQHPTIIRKVITEMQNELYVFSGRWKCEWRRRGTDSSSPSGVPQLRSGWTSPCPLCCRLLFSGGEMKGTPGAELGHGLLAGTVRLAGNQPTASVLWFWPRHSLISSLQP